METFYHRCFRDSGNLHALAFFSCNLTSFPSFFVSITRNVLRARNAVVPNLEKIVVDGAVMVQSVGGEQLSFPMTQASQAAWIDIHANV